MTEVECPYCGNEFEDENFGHDYLSDIEAECPRCEKIFLYNIYYFNSCRKCQKGNRMKFISNFYLCFIGFATIWSVTLVFVSNASIYSWGAAIGLAIITALISNHYDGKHDK